MLTFRVIFHWSESFQLFRTTDVYNIEKLRKHQRRFGVADRII